MTSFGSRITSPIGMCFVGMARNIPYQNRYMARPIFDLYQPVNSNSNGHDMEPYHARKVFAQQSLLTILDSVWPA